MTDSILLTGKRGSGKTLAAMRLAGSYISEGRPVATNLNMFLENLVHPSNKVICYRLPDFPSSADLLALPPGNPNPIEEEKNGLLILDEVSKFLNARDWQNKDRLDVMSWLVESRKYGWDLLFLGQHQKQLDSSVRDALVDFHGQLRRLDKVRVPFIGAIYKHFFGKGLYFPKIHVATLFYGFDRNAPIFDKWWFRGKRYYTAYDTTQKISAVTGQDAPYSYLSAWHLRGRYMSLLDMYKPLIITAALVGLFVGALGGFAAGRFQPAEAAQVVSESVSSDVFVTGVIRDESSTRIVLSDGRHAYASKERHDKTGSQFFTDGVWYRGQS